MVTTAEEARAQSTISLRRFEDQLVKTVFEQVATAVTKPNVMSIEILLNSDEKDKYDILLARGFLLSPTWDVFERTGLTTAKFKLSWW